MKDSWKRFLCALALVPCVGVMAACDSKADDSTGSDTEQSTDTEEGTQSLNEAQAYGKAVSISEKLKSGEQKVMTMDDHAYEIMYMGDYTIVNEDGSRTALNLVNPQHAEIKATLDAILLEGDEGNRMVDQLGGRFVMHNVGYDLNTGEMYNETFVKIAQGYDEGTMSGEEIKASVGDFTEEDLMYATYMVKHSDNHVKHVYIPYNTPQTSSQYISADHFVKSSHEEGLQGLLNDSFGLNVFEEAPTYEEFKTQLTNLVLEQTQEMGSTLTLDDFNINFEIKKVGENYILNAIASTKQPIEMEVDGATTLCSLNMTQQMAFTEEKLLSSTAVMSMTADAILTLPLGEGGANVTVSMPMYQEMATTSLFDTVISAENQELIDSENYDATSAVNATGSVEYYIDGVNIAEHADYAEMDSVFELDDAWLEEYADKATFTDWYLDEECTIPYTAEALPKYTSYTIKLYAKTSEVKEGYVRTIVNFITGDDYYDDDVETEIFYQPAGEYNLGELFAISGYEIEKVVLNGVEIDFSQTIVAESKAMYEISVYYVHEK